MNIIQGIPASPGIAIGPALIFLEEEDITIPRYSIAQGEVELEWARFLVALERSRADIAGLRDRARREMGDQHGAIFDAHLLMLEDPDMLGTLEVSLADSLSNIEWVLHQYEQNVVRKLENLNDPIMQERGADIHDISTRILRHLMLKERFSLADLDRDVVLVAKNLLPSDMIGMNRAKVKGIVMVAGGKTSHTAILARAFEIPAVLGLGNAARTIKSGDMLVVDGSAGKVNLEPDASALEAARAAIQKLEEREAGMAKNMDKPAATTDGRVLSLKANIEVPEETTSALRHGADGIGLFRSEFLFLQPGRPPSEESQYQAYRRVIEGMEGKPVTIRTLDVGGDKMVPELVLEDEKNPLLGWRAIRYCLSDSELFQNQLRAILRASAFGDARIMFPMISGPGELDAAIAALEEAKAECTRRGQAYRQDMPLGIMIEIPSAAMTADLLAAKVDFMSIGTNDLIQYSLAVDRGNERVAYLYEPFHPAVLRFIKMTIDAGHDAGIPVSMCGEMASDPTAALVLLGLGLDEFSMSSVALPDVKAVIRAFSYAEAADAARTVMEMGSHREIEAFLSARVAGILGE